MIRGLANDEDRTRKTDNVIIRIRDEDGEDGEETEGYLILAGLLLIAFDSMDPQEEIADAVLPVRLYVRYSAIADRGTSHWSVRSNTLKRGCAKLNS
jgi:hypothetical protein